MDEPKTSCPKCAGHVSYPKALAGEIAPCPHCGESILLPKQKLPTAWIIAGVLGFIIICLTGVIVFERFPKKPARQRPSIVNLTATPAESSSQTGARNQSESAHDSADIKEMIALCEDFYTALNNKDQNALLELMSKSCRNALTPAVVRQLFEDQTKYEFRALESVRFQDGALGTCAVARARRRVEGGIGGIQEGWRDLNFIKESGHWKLFRNYEIMEVIEEEFIKSGFTDDVKARIELLRSGDPFGEWDKNDTNTLAKVFRLRHQQTPVFPWDIQLTIGSNKVDRLSLGFDFSVRNTSAETWDSPRLEFELKRDGKRVLSDNAFLQNVRPGQEIQREASFFIKDALQETTKFDLDVFYSLAGKQCPLVQNLPVEFKVQKLTQQLKFDILKTSFELASTLDLNYIWSARIDYRIKNVSSQPIKDLEIKCVWSLLNGEMLDQSSDYVIGYRDVPLGAGQTKSGFIRCGKGYSNAKVPVKVDIYLESKEIRSLVVKAFQIR